jgi:hypothetical protein
MKTNPIKLIRIWQESGKLAGELACTNNLTIQPGQYVAISDGTQAEVLPQIFFPILSGHNHFQIWPLPTAWQPGLELTIRGPFGHGFHPPAGCNKYCLVAWDRHPARLIGLLHQAIQSNKEVILVFDRKDAGFDMSFIPDSIEILPHQNLADAIEWADYIAMDCDISTLDRVKPISATLQKRQHACPVEVLVKTDMPCLGLAECGICAVATRRGWRLACKHGPVFDFFELNLE